MIAFVHVLFVVYSSTLSLYLSPSICLILYHVLVSTIETRLPNGHSLLRWTRISSTHAFCFTNIFSKFTYSTVEPDCSATQNHLTILLSTALNDLTRKKQYFAELSLSLSRLRPVNISSRRQNTPPILFHNNGWHATHARYFESQGGREKLRRALSVGRPVKKFNHRVARHMHSVDNTARIFARISRRMVFTARTPYEYNACVIICTRA